MANSTIKIVRGDSALLSPRRYWPVLLTAAVLAESAHAPLMGWARTALPGGAVAKAGKTLARPPEQIYGRDDREFKPIAFADKNQPEDRREPLARLTPESPFTFHPEIVRPDDPETPRTGLVPMPDPTNLFVEETLSPGGPTIGNAEIFPTFNPSAGITGGTPTQTPGEGTITVGVGIGGASPTAVPEPGSVAACICGISLCCRRRRSLA